MSAPRPDHLGLGYSSHPGAAQGRSGSPNSNNNSPIDSSASSARSHFGLSAGLNSTAIMAANSRSGAGSPSHELGGSSRLFSKRYVSSLLLQPRPSLTLLARSLRPRSSRPLIRASSTRHLRFMAAFRALITC
ncbi:hypothetical protein NLG97_g8457 [Lecanicillium saksenae]|uniref:Uncharacterized protein n=1 Tax=Lecanicillium saksenae TaxID=468837 RepID=A0ACC1QK79_9HYPO|nr:hypothetical protein NLG97_g8457 [Lecanicillium saksenae]